MQITGEFISFREIAVLKSYSLCALHTIKYTKFPGNKRRAVYE